MNADDSRNHSSSDKSNINDHGDINSECKRDGNREPSQPWRANSKPDFQEIAQLLRDSSLEFSEADIEAGRVS